MILFLALLAFAEPAATETAATPSAPKVKEKKICRFDVETGSFMSHRTCHTKAEWVSIDAQNAANASQLQDSLSGPTASPK